MLPKREYRHCPSPCLTCGHVARYWCMDGSRAGGQEDGTRGAPCHIFAHFAHFDRGKLRRPARDPARDPLSICLTFARVNAGICTFSAFARKPCAARLCGTCALLEFDPIAGSMAGGGPEEGSAAAGGSAGDSASATCRAFSRQAGGEPVQGGGGFHCQVAVLSLILL